MLGLPCNMQAIQRIARKHKLLVIEDAAQACGGSYRGKPLGSMGHAGAFSFNHYKILSCGEGGAVVTNDKAVYHRAMICHDGGCVFFDMNMAAEQPPFFAGTNFRVNEIQSAILNVQLSRLDGILKTLRARKAAMAAILAKADSFRLSACNDPDGTCGTHLPLLFDSEKAACDFIARHKDAGCGLFRPFDTNRHVYATGSRSSSRRLTTPSGTPGTGPPQDPPDSRLLPADPRPPQADRRHRRAVRQDPPAGPDSGTADGGVRPASALTHAFRHGTMAARPWTTACSGTSPSSSQEVLDETWPAFPAAPRPLAFHRRSRLWHRRHWPAST